jgi:hypothetical protein
MQKLDDRDQATLLSALLRMRLGKILLLFSVILFFYEFIPPGMFKGYEVPLEKYDAGPPEKIVLYTPVVFDSIDIRNGIHVPTGMIADTGCAEVVQNCGGCHSLDLVKQNRATKEGWKDIISWMQETQKLWDLGLQEETILHYLAKNYGPKNTGRRKNLEDIEWYNL